MTQNGEPRSTSELETRAAVHSPVIDIISDVVCPWCFIGKRRLEKALALLGLPNVSVRWKPFQLNPDAPKEGMDRQSFRARKFGSLARSQELEARGAAAGAEEGIEFRFGRIRKVPNTFEAHRLI
jgi:predicted DsbA family dithiol-disulfide isomerase